MSGSERIFVALGANLGDAAATLGAAQAALAALPHTRLIAASALYRSAPVGVDGQPDYLNGVVELASALEPLALLAALQAIEQAHGRERAYHQAPRTLDLDLLLYGQRSLDSAGLTLPHPRMHLRAFVLLPLAEIAPDASIPGIGPIAPLLATVAAQRIERL